MSRHRFTWRTLLGACLLALFAAVPARAQTAVRGRVVDGDGSPVAGATLTVQNTTTRTVTASDGTFSLTVPDLTATLVVSAMGFGTQSVPLAGRAQVEIRLGAVALQMEEVVVVGYGTQRKSDVTGAVASVNAERLQNNPSRSVEQALQGAVPGVQVSTAGGGAEGSTNILIRGRSSINASTDPLVVVDGIPFNGTLSEINQNDIGSIEVLKDASAAAIYGSRGSNGVILITTKRGGGARPTISYDVYAGTQEITNLPRLMNGQEFAQYKCDRLNGGEDCDEVLTATELSNLQAGRSADWVDLATRRGFQQSHNLSFSGGTGGTRYYIAGSLLDVAGVAKGDEFNRYTLRVNLDQELKTWLKIGTNTQMSLVDRGGMSASFTDAFFMNPLTNPFNEDGTQTLNPWPEDVFWGNPLEGLLVTNDDKSRRVFTSNYVEAQLPLEGLSVRLNAGLDFADRDQGTYYGRNTLTGSTSQGRAIVDHSTRWDWTVEGLLNYLREFGEHRVAFTGLVSGQGNNLDSDGLRSEGFPNDVLTYYQANVGQLLVPSVAVTHSRLLSQMGRLNYTYGDRYLLTLTARRDGFSGFGRDDKWGVFPSLAVGWNVSNESFFPSSTPLNSLKVRASWGRNGNQAISPYQTLAGLDDYSYVDGDQTAPGYIPRSLGNPNLRWETTESLNGGIDFALWRNRVQGSIDVYERNTSDLLLRRAISPVHGATSIMQNIGETRNRGIEVQVSGRAIERGRFSWSPEFNLAANRNEIVDLYGDGQDDVANQWFIGEAIGVNYEYEFGGIWQVGDDIANSAQPTAKPGDVKIVDRNGDGKITPDDRTIIGSQEPDYVATLNNTFRFGAFSLFASLYTVQGVTYANNLLGTNLVQALVRRNTVYREYWTPENPINTYPANSETSNPLSVGFFEDASFIRLRDLTVSYDVPSRWTERLGASNLKLYVNGRNLWTHTDWSGLDPELVTSTGIQRSVPLERVITGGINVRF